ncbi:MAG: hypothetical protein JRJ29_16405 [Deltaproteobacteria bacterium]|nr:hypothetical protein [Deltaproteobacteria bacterium]
MKGRKFDSIETQNDWLKHWEERWAAVRIHGRVRFPHILLFLDRDQAGRSAVRQVRNRLRRHGLVVTVFDWHQLVPCNGQGAEPIADSIQHPADMSVEQLRMLRNQGIL